MPGIRVDGWQFDLSERGAAVDEEPPARCQGGSDACSGADSGFGVASVEGSDTDGECEVERGLVRVKGEVLGGDAAGAEQALRYLVGSALFDEGDAFG